MTDRPRYPRTGCCVPFCRRTSTLFKTEWLCGDHWRLVDRVLKTFRTKRLRMISRLAAKYEAQTKAAQAALQHGAPDGPVWEAVNRQLWAEDRWRRVETATWRRMKAQAIERAAGG